MRLTSRPSSSNRSRASAAAVVIPPSGYLQRLREICTATTSLLIFDEVITGSRCGAPTAAAAFGVNARIFSTFAKQVTNGVAAARRRRREEGVYETFMAAGGPRLHAEFRTATRTPAHPVACAAGIAALDLLQQEHAIERVAELAPYFENAVHGLKGRKHVVESATSASPPASRSTGAGEPAKRRSRSR